MNTVVWLILTIAFVAVEISTVGLVSIWFALGALTALFASLLHASFLVQIILFVLVSALSLALIYPKLRRDSAVKQIPTNADRIVGMRAAVTEKIDTISGTGAIKVDGKVWSARSENGSEIQPGTLVTVLRIEGVRAIVETVPGNEQKGN